MFVFSLFSLIHAEAQTHIQEYIIIIINIHNINTYKNRFQHKISEKQQKTCERIKNKVNSEFSAVYDEK